MISISKKDQVATLLEIAIANQLFQFNDCLYEQTDGAAMGSPFDPLMANVLMRYLEEKLESDGLLPTFYRRYVDDTLLTMPSHNSREFLDNNKHLTPKFIL